MCQFSHLMQEMTNERNQPRNVSVKGASFALFFFLSGSLPRRSSFLPPRANFADFLQIRRFGPILDWIAPTHFVVQRCASRLTGIPRLPFRKRSAPPAVKPLLVEQGFPSKIDKRPAT